MGIDNLFKKERQLKEKRKIEAKKSMLDNILILCEGEKTEPNYFNGFKKDYRLTNVEIRGLGCNTDSITQMAIDERKNYAQIWCVFDRDSFTKQNFNRAFQMIQKYPNIKIAYSNEAFELWYLLHFNYYNTGMSRTQYKATLTSLLGEKYKKRSVDMYDKLLNRQDVAIKNAKTLLEIYSPINPETDNPSTSVYKLVEELNKYKD